MARQKIVPSSKIKHLSRRLKATGKKIIFTNGTFDLLHLGHIAYLEKARALGDVLMVGVNSDSSVRSYKDPGRPIVPELDRMKVLSALECVDYVVKFKEPTPLRLIRLVRPDVLVKGADWKISQIAGAQEIASWGGRVKRIKLVPGRSTTALIKKIRALRKP